MSMHPQPIPAIPEETVQVARAVLPKGNVLLRMRDELGTLYTDEDFRDLFPTRGQPAEARLSPGSDHAHAICGRVNRPPGG
jgi:transposase